VLENVFEAWRIIPKAALSDLDIALEQVRDIGKKEGFFDKILSFVKKIFKKPKKAVKMVYSFLLEMPSHVLFFWANPYWTHCVLALWRLYWALVLDKEPFPADLATVGALYFKENDFVKAAKKMALELKKKWQVDKQAIEKEKFPFKPDQIEEPDTLRFLREAVLDLVDLHNRNELPSVCLAHHKVHWAGCPVCEGKEKEK